MSRSILTKILLIVTLCAGVTICLWEIYTFPIQSVDLILASLCLFAILVGNKLTVNMPGAEGAISTTSTFVFLVLLLYGENAAVLLATIESLSRYARNKQQLLFRSAIMAISTFLTVLVLNLTFGNPSSLPLLRLTTTFIAAICIMAYSQSTIESGLVGIGNALIFDKTQAQTFKQYYLYSSIAHVVNATLAGASVLLIGTIGFVAYFITLPFVIVSYLGYQTVVTKIHLSDEQARRALTRVEALNSYIAKMREPSLQLKNSQPSKESTPFVTKHALVHEATGSSRHLRVFLCHCSDDKPAVRDLYRRLIEEGVDVWFDEERLLPGQDWEHEISKAVRTSDLVIVCLSLRSINKAGYGQKEIKFALDTADQQPEDSIFIVPLKLEDCDVPDRLTRWQWVNLFEDGGYGKLVNALNYSADILSRRAATTHYPSSHTPGLS